MNKSTYRAWLRETQAAMEVLDRQRTVEERKRQERHARRLAKDTAAKPRPTCGCKAYRWPHRRGGGLCRWPEPPEVAWDGEPGRHLGTFGRVNGGSSATRRRLLRRYGWHPIHDRARIRRWLPKLYVAWSRRYGLPWAYGAMGGWVPAMLVTEHGVPAGVDPYDGPDFQAVVLQGTSRRRDHDSSPAVKRCRNRVASRCSAPSRSALATA